MKKRKSRDPLAIETARRLENVESVKAWLAKFRAESAAKAAADVERTKAWLAKFRAESAAKHEAWLAKFRAESAAYRAESAATDALIVDTFKEIESGVKQMCQMVPEMAEKFQQALETIRARDPREQRKKQAAAIRREYEALVDELRRGGVRNPVTRAKEEMAKRHGHASGAAFDRWQRRNRR